ncbi:hypothetical protein JCM3775_006725 [Rhodotorula graminis]
MSQSAVEMVPLEIWGVVRHKLVDLELREAEFRQVESYLCESGRAPGVSAEKLKWSDVLSRCGAELFGFEGLEDSAARQAADIMLSVFGLALPFDVPIFRAAPDNYPPASHWSSPDTSMMISLPGPPSDEDDGRAMHAACGGDVCADGQVVVDVSFAIPAGAKQRFRRLVSTMHLDLVNVTDGFIANAGTRAASSGRAVRCKEREFEKVPLAKLEPRWKLVTMAETEW